MAVKNKKKSKKSRDFTSQDDIDYKELKHLYLKLKQHIDVIEKTKQTIPASIFTKKLSSLETISKYLHENVSLSYEQISKLTNRSSKTIWQSCKSANKKHPSSFIVKSFAITIPVSIFKNRKLSILEHLVTYLKDEYGMKFSEIAKILKRDQRTIWTVHNRAKKKHAKK